MRKLKITSYFCLSLVMIIGLMTIIASGGGGGGSDTPVDDTIDPNNIVPSSITTFTEEVVDICLEDGKPVIRMYSSPTCGYCAWDADAFDPVVQKYVADGSIVAHHWDIRNLSSRTGDDLLTSEVEGIIPESEIEIFETYNQDYSTPFFSFGCKYTRIGATRYYSDDLEGEAAEFMAVIEELLDQVQ